MSSPAQHGVSPAAPERPARALVLLFAWLGVLLGLMLMVLFAGTYASTTSPAARVTGQLVTVLAFAGWAAAAFRNPWWAPRRALLVPGLVAMAGVAASSAFSPEPRLALGGLLVAGCSLAAFLLLERLGSHPFFRPRLQFLVVATAITLPVLFLLQAVATWVEWWQLIGRLAVPPLRPAWVSLTFGSPNIVAVVIVLLAPQAMAVIATSGAPARGRGIGIAILGVLVLAASGVAASRGGILGLGATVVVGGVLVLARSGRLSRRALVLGAAGILGAMAVVLAVLIARSSQGGDALRFEFWRTALAVFAERPLTGGGPDTWALLKLLEARPGESTIIVAHAHNVYVWTLAELGIIGTLSVVLFVVMVLARIGRRAWSPDLRTSGAAIAALASFAGLAVHSLVDVLTNLPAVVLLVALVAARALADEEVPGRVAPAAPWYRPAVAVTGLGILVMTVAFVRVDQGMAAAALARTHLLEGDAPAAQAGFHEAGSVDPIPLYRNEEALAAAFAGDTATALRLVGDTVARDGLAHHLILQGYLRARTGDLSGAVTSARRAMDVGWADPGVYLNASRIGEMTGDRMLAQDGLQQAAELAPATLGDPYWRDAGRAIPYDELVRRMAPAPAGTDLGAGALGELEERLRADPQDWQAAATLAGIEASLGRIDDAVAHARWADIVQSDAASSVYFAPRRIGGAMDRPQFRLGGDYPLPVYAQPGSGLLFGPDGVALIP